MANELTPWQRRRRTARLVVRWAALGTFAAQVAVAGGLMLAEEVKRRKRKPFRFPTAPARPIEAGNDIITVYSFGEDLYADMLKAIEGAQHSVYLETFIWKDDEVGQLFKDAVVAASRRGVEVRLVYDVFANLVVPPTFFRFPDPIKVRRHPIIGSPWWFRPRNTGRDHRKLLVVDSEVAFLGGYNIGTLYADRWRDTHARYTGPSVAELENAFVDYWNSGPRGILFGRRHFTPMGNPPNRQWDQTVRIHRNTPRHAVYPIRNMYLEAIDKASERVWLTQAYLIPDSDFIGALREAVERGVDVRIIVPERSNHVVADWLSRGFYETLLHDGVRLFLYQNAMVHAKTGTIDGIWSTIGTANLDRLSLLGNYEANAEIMDAGVAARMEEIFAMDEENSRELTRDQWQRRSLLARATEELLSPWRPLF